MTPLVLPDGFALTDLDIVYPPMVFTKQWLEDWPQRDRPYLPMLRSIGQCLDPWRAGWYLVNAEGGRQFLSADRESHYPWLVEAYTFGHARHLMGLPIAKLPD